MVGRLFFFFGFLFELASKLGFVRHGPNLNISGPKGLSLSLREFQSDLGY